MHAHIHMYIHNIQLHTYVHAHIHISVNTALSKVFSLYITLILQIQSRQYHYYMQAQPILAGPGSLVIDIITS